MMKGTYRNATDAANHTVDDGWGTLTWLANEPLTGNKGLTLGRVVIRQGKANPRHCHPTCEEVLYLLRGKLRHTLGGDAVTLNPGDTLSIPAGVFHNAVNIGDEDADMIVAYSTGRRDFQLEHSSVANE
ncbi:cupin domain-containing protein [Phycisphaerales bacterium AB-hyl4]|uniref:Cupin domain-containing protein n=1 Tax=Natronomicrosphaera hydrolytica TaxID=3242702 RepID=A0ABV4U430_9BACT